MEDYRYQLIRSRKLTEGISLRIKDNGEIIVRAPFWVPIKIIENYLSEKSIWIRDSLQKIISSREGQKEYVHGEKHLFFGSEFILQIKYVEEPVRTTIRFQENKLIACTYRGHSSEKSKMEVRDALHRWYLEQGIGVITDKVNFFTEKLGVQYSKIEIKKVSTIWGSCSPSNALSFNRKLILAPHEIVDYVVIHEVCHLIERNHSSRFWAQVAKLDPDYRAHRGWLRKNHFLLSL